jgi:hypothetical protein
MRTFLHKSCRENQNTLFMFIKFFPKITPFMRQCQKMWWILRGYRSHIWHMYVVCWIRKATCTHVHAHAHSPRHTHAHTYKYVIFIALSEQQCFVNATQCYVIPTLSVFLILLYRVLDVYMLPICNILNKNK